MKKIKENKRNKLVRLKRHLSLIGNPKTNVSNERTYVPECTAQLKRKKHEKAIRPSDSNHSSRAESFIHRHFHWSDDPIRTDPCLFYRTLNVFFLNRKQFIVFLFFFAMNVSKYNVISNNDRTVTGFNPYINVSM